jgi:hypothetical protein
MLAQVLFGNGFLVDSNAFAVLPDIAIVALDHENLLNFIEAARASSHRTRIVIFLTTHDRPTMKLGARVAG